MDSTAFDKVTVRPRVNSYEFLTLSAEDHIYRQMSYGNEFYEAGMLRALSPFLSPGDFVVDVGANIGTHSVFWAGENLCNVLSFEPVRIAYELLVRNVGRNGLEHVVFPRNFGLGDTENLATVDSISKTNLGATKLLPHTGGDIIVRQLDTLPEMRSNVVRLVKIDVEGMEADVLNGASLTIGRDKPLIVCECQDEESLDVVRDILDPLEYELMEQFNSTPTYLFVHPGWWESGRFPRSIYESQRGQRYRQRQAGGKWGG